MKTYNELLREEKTAALKKALKDAGFGDLDLASLGCSIYKVSFRLTRDPKEFHEIVRYYIERKTSYKLDPSYYSDLKPHVPSELVDFGKFYTGEWDVEKRYLFRISKSRIRDAEQDQYIGYCPESSELC